MYAPEHLIVNVEDAEEWLPMLDNAGVCMCMWGGVGWVGGRGRDRAGALALPACLAGWGRAGDCLTDRLTRSSSASAGAAHHMQ